ncbi:MAG: hypothetical protein JSS86_12385 [Cyanobacteria bacterium SZAS LIN-2]|nr:hypothetical protein [Cyanobacteria bacterium SZAS LIN-3]MBS1997108.1 hypothetical protein [Cyanobacteria bacterium SZAS LIN-2]MBS2006369.1 hypothetical protein [Cyanobacteria bacterium SZAS TMP-1]
MSTNTKLTLLGLAVVVVLGFVLQTMVTGYLDKQMGAESQLLSPDEAAKQAKKEALKTQKKFEAASKNK